MWISVRGTSISQTSRAKIRKVSCNLYYIDSITLLVPFPTVLHTNAISKYYEQIRNIVSKLIMSSRYSDCWHG